MDGELTLTFSGIEDVVETDPSFSPDVTMKGLSEYLKVTVKYAIDGGEPVTAYTKTIDEAADTSIVIANLAYGKSVVFTFEYQIPWETGNEIQGASLDFDLVFKLEQKKPVV